MATTKTAERTTQQAAPKQAPTGNVPAKVSPPIVQFREYVEARMATLEEALPPTITPKRFVSVVITALQNKPKLLECTFPSLWNACVRAAQDGLLPDGREGAIAPYGENKDGKRVAEIATWMPMVEGYRKKVFEAGGVKSWRVEVVFEKDEFDYDLAEQKIHYHRRPLTDKPPGGVVGAYSVAKLANDEVVLEIMSAFQIKQIADKSKAGNGPWKDAAFFSEMCKKVVARRHYKQLPHSESMDAMIARDDETHGLLDETTPRIAAPPQRRIAPREAFDAYAGETIDADTGEVLADDAGFDTGEGKQEIARSGPGSTGGPVASKGAGAAEAVPSAAVASASTTNTNAAPSERSAEGTSMEAAAGPTTGDKPSGAASTTSQDQPDLLSEDGGDRPWPPSEVPSNAAEYERYFNTMLATFEKGQSGALKIWYLSTAEKSLRTSCDLTNDDKLRSVAIARMNEIK